MEHLHHFQLSEDPFRTDASEKFDVPLASQQQALARVERGVRQGKGLVVLVGGIGAGKTRVARRLYEALEEEVFEAGMMVVLRREVDGEWLLARFAKQLGVDEPEAEREALMAQIYERLAIVHEDGRRAVLIIDEAHGLASADTLAEVCGLVKLEYEDRRLLSVVLVGAPPLDRAIAADPLLLHNVDLRVELPPLSRDEAASYVATRLQVAGGDPGRVLPGANVALHASSGGAPGRLNALADNALYEAWLAERAELTRADVETAARALGWAVDGSGETAVPAKPAAAPRRSPDAAQAEHTVMAMAAPGDSLSGLDLDPQLDAVFEEPAAGASAAADAHPTQLMDFDRDDTPTRSAPRPPAAEPTRVELREVAAPPKTEDDVDDLFMELLDD